MALRFTLRQLGYFMAVGEAGSIAGAAERISVSSSSISAAIAQLEEEFGIQLFIRQHAQGLALTPGGRQFLHQAKLVLEQAEALHAVAGDIAGAAKGPLRIGCMVTVAPVVLAPMRRSFEAEYPEARVAQATAHQAELIGMLQRAEIDVAITYDLEVPQDLDFAPLAELPPYAMVAADHALAGRASVPLEALIDEPLILLDLPLSREYMISMFQVQGLRPRIAERVREMEVVRSLAAAGFGYGLGNIRGPLATADGGRLAMLALEGPVRPMILGLATMRGPRKPRVLTAFVEHCRSMAAAARLPGVARA